MLIKPSLLLAVAFGILLPGCSSTGRLNNSDRLTIKGFVMRPDSSRVKGAIIRSEPPSELVTSATDGSFTISQGLKPGQYDFIAEDKGYEGRTTSPVQFGKSERMGYIVIIIEKTMQMKPLKPGDNRIPSTVRGEKRSSN